MRFEENQGVRFGIFPAFDSFPEVKTRFSTRIGGVSRAPYDTLNLGRHTDDEEDAVRRNRLKFCKATGIDPGRLVFQNQVHSDNVNYVKEPGTCSDTDAIFTDVPGIFLAVTAADCVPVFFYWTERRVAGVIHAGWKGTAGKIAQKTMVKLQKRYGGDLSSVIAVVGPSISVQHYEVSDDVAVQFDDRVVDRDRGPRPHVDLWKANMIQLEEAGVGRVECSQLCTFDNPELFFSHRQSGGRTGRMLGVIGIEEDHR